MSKTAWKRLLFPGALALAAALPLLGHAIGGRTGAGCAADGVALAGSPVVKLVSEDGDDISFCCVGCAEAWPASPSSRQILVTDELTGRMIDARDAWFVRSLVVAQPATEDRVHAFASEEEARRHLGAYRGVLLTGRLHPFGGKGGQ